MVLHDTRVVPNRFCASIEKLGITCNLKGGTGRTTTEIPLAWPTRVTVRFPALSDRIFKILTAALLPFEEIVLQQKNLCTALLLLKKPGPVPIRKVTGGTKVFAEDTVTGRQRT